MVVLCGFCLQQSIATESLVQLAGWLGNKDSGGRIQPQGHLSTIRDPANMCLASLIRLIPIGLVSSAVVYLI